MSYNHAISTYQEGVEADYVTICCNASLFTLYIYELLLTLNQSSKTILQCRWTGPSLLYICMHTITLLAVSQNLYFSLFASCKSIYISNIIGSVMEMLLYIIGGVIAAIHIYAINGHKWTRPIIIVCLYAPLVGTSLYAAIVATYLVEPFGCSISYNYSVAVSPGLIAFSWVCIAASDLLMLLETWYATYGIHNTVPHANTDLSISALLRQDCFIHSSLMLTTWALYLGIHLTILLAHISQFANVINTILISRLFLNLRGGHSSGNTTTNSIPVSSIQFASWVMRQFGESIEEDIENTDVVDSHNSEE